MGWPNKWKHLHFCSVPFSLFAPYLLLKGRLRKHFIARLITYFLVIYYAKNIIHFGQQFIKISGLKYFYILQTTRATYRSRTRISTIQFRHEDNIHRVENPWQLPGPWAVWKALGEAFLSSFYCGTSEKGFSLIPNANEKPDLPLI